MRDNKKDVAVNKEQETLERLKRYVRNWNEYFKDNCDRYREYIKFVFISSITESESSINKRLKRPNIEVNSLESYVSRLRGEFSKNIPSVTVSVKEGSNADAQLANILEMHFRAILDDANKKGLEYNIYTDTLAGGFSTGKVFVDYDGEMSMNQNIFMTQGFDSTMVGFDPMAREDDKSDGRVAFECIPMRRDEFELAFPDVPTNELPYSRNIEGFEWSYNISDEDIIVVCDMYEKVAKNKKIVLLANGRVVSLSDYKKYLRIKEEQGDITQAIAIIGKPRTTTVTKIVRHRFIENKIIKTEDTNYDSLPLVFFDGNSVLYKSADNTSVQQVTRPVVYQAKGAQRLKNSSLQSLVNELENINQGQFITPLEAIPADNDLAEMYRTPQQANVLVYNQFYKGDPKTPLNPPQVLQRRPIPGEIMQAFTQSDAEIQKALGSFDMNLAKLSEREMSGVAIQETITLSNAAAMPYIVGFYRGLQGMLNVALELMPKIYTTSRSIPVMQEDGKRGYVTINPVNGESGIKFKFDKNDFQVKVEPGQSFGVQKAKAFDAIATTMKVSPQFNAFVNEQCLPELIDNMPDIRGLDTIKEKSEVFMQQLQQAKQMAMQNQPQDPNILFAEIEGKKNADKTKIEFIKVLQDARQAQEQMKLDLEKLAIEREKMQLDAAKILAEIERTKVDQQLATRKARSDEDSKAADIAMRAIEHSYDQQEKQDKAAEAKEKEKAKLKAKTKAKAKA